MNFTTAIEFVPDPLTIKAVISMTTLRQTNQSKREKNQVCLTSPVFTPSPHKVLGMAWIPSYCIWINYIHFLIQDPLMLLPGLISAILYGDNSPCY